MSAAESLSVAAAVAAVTAAPHSDVDVFRLMTSIDGVVDLDAASPVPVLSMHCGCAANLV